MCEGIAPCAAPWRGGLLTSDQCPGSLQDAIADLRGWRSYLVIDNHTRAVRVKGVTGSLGAGELPEEHRLDLVFSEGRWTERCAGERYMHDVRCCTALLDESLGILGSVLGDNHNDDYEATCSRDIRRKLLTFLSVSYTHLTLPTILLV